MIKNRISLFWLHARKWINLLAIVVGNSFSILALGYWLDVFWYTLISYILALVIQTYREYLLYPELLEGNVRSINQEIEKEKYIADSAKKLIAKTRLSSLIIKIKLKEKCLRVQGLSWPYPNQIILNEEILNELNKKDLKSVIAHEISHIQRNDLAINSLILFFRDVILICIIPFLLISSLSFIFSSNYILSQHGLFLAIISFTLRLLNEFFYAQVNQASEHLADIGAGCLSNPKNLLQYFSEYKDPKSKLSQNFQSDVAPFTTSHSTEITRAPSLFWQMAHMPRRLKNRIVAYGEPWFRTHPSDTLRCQMIKDVLPDPYLVKKAVLH